MSYFKFIVLLTHPKLAAIALPLSTSREGDVRWRTWGESTIKYDIKLLHLLRMIVNLILFSIFFPHSFFLLPLFTIQIIRNEKTQFTTINHSSINGFFADHIS